MEQNGLTAPPVRNKVDMKGDDDMKLLFKQRFFSWLDSYDVYDENGRTLYTVEGKLGWGHVLHILDQKGQHAATLKEVVLTFLRPKFEMLVDGCKVGTLTKEITFFKPRFDLDFNGWSVSGDFWEWDYRILDDRGDIVAVVSKEIWNWTDTYSIEVADPADALYALMVTLAIDAEKCTRDS